MPTKSMEEWMRLISEQNAFNPAKIWIESKPWDGVDRFEELAQTVRVPDDQFHIWRVFLKKWLISGVAALYDDNFSARGVLTFTGEQGIGKTSWFRNLVPRNEGMFLEGLHLDPGNKDSKIAATSYWIVELGELESTFGKDLARLKSFITAEFDDIRVPYAKEADRTKRASIYGASVNDKNFLVDKTGNSRWWVTETLEILYNHSVDMQQVWAQAAVLFSQGESYHLDQMEEKELRRVNAQYEAVDPIKEELLDAFEFGPVDSPDYQGSDNWDDRWTNTEILKYLDFPSDRSAAAKRLGQILRQLCINQVSYRVDDRGKSHRGRYYKMPPRSGQELTQNKP